MQDLINKLLNDAPAEPRGVHLIIVALAACLEYVIPPIPGDLLVLVAAFLVGAKGWSLPGVMVAVNAGSAVGLTLDYIAGRLVARYDARWRERFPRWRRLGDTIDRIKLSFQRWGVLFIACNRFLPAVRGLFFVAAGMARLPYWKVLLWGLVSSVLWNCLIFAAGIAVGHNWEDFYRFFETYRLVAWILLSLGALALIVRWWSRAGAPNGL